MTVLKLISVLALASSALADEAPEDVVFVFAAEPVSEGDVAAYPCEDIFSNSVLNAFRRTAVVQFQKKKMSDVDGLRLMRALDENLALLDSGLNNLTIQYHTDCQACEEPRTVSCCLAGRAIWASRISETYENAIDDLCTKALKVKVTAAECTTPLKQLNLSNDIAELLRCEAQCKYEAYAKEPICDSKYK